MTATWAYYEQPRTKHPLLPGASPRDIRAALLPEDRDEFDAAYGDALAKAGRSLDLTELFKTLEHWRRVALLHSNPTAYHRVVRRAAAGARRPGPDGRSSKGMPSRATR